MEKSVTIKHGRIAVMFFAVLAAGFFCLLFCGFSVANAAEPPATVTLIYDSRSYSYTESYIKPTDFTVKEEFEKRKLNAPVGEKTDLVYRLVRGGADIKDAMLYCFPRLEKIVDKAVGEIYADPVDSEIRFFPKRRPMFEITKSIAGYKLSEERIYNDIFYALSKGFRRVTLVPMIIKPQVSEHDLIPLTQLRASFSTSYATSGENRKHNIKLALSKINGLRLDPGESFSFNKTVGPRTEENGFKNSMIIVEGKYTEGVGGGVCQVSTTVYNCALLAGMSVTSARNHTLVPSYVPPSFDAMVSSWSDLRFENPCDKPIFFRTVYTDDKATVEAYSNKLPYKIRTESVLVSRGEIPADEEFVDKELKYTQGLAEGEKVRVSNGSVQLKSEGYIIYEYDNGQSKRIKLRTDNYSGAGAQIAVAPPGPKNPDDDPASKSRFFTSIPFRNSLKQW